MTTTITPLTQAESEFLNMLVEHIIKTKYRSQKGKRDKIRWSVYQTWQTARTIMCKILKTG